MRKRKPACADKKTYIDFVAADGDVETDLHEQFFKIINLLVFGDQEAIKARLESDASLKDFYYRNEGVLSKLNKDSRVPESLKLINSLPMILKSRETMAESNRIFGDEFYPEGSLDAPARIIDIILTKTIDEIENNTSKQINPLSRSYAPAFLANFSRITHTKMSTLKTYSQLHVIFIQRLFMIYGPDLVWKSQEFFETNKDKSETAEYANSFHIWACAALAASSAFDEPTYEKILDIWFTRLEPCLSILKTNLLGKILPALSYGLCKQTYSRIQKIWDWVVKKESEMSDDSKWLLLKVCSFLLNITGGLTPVPARECMDRLMKIDASDPKRVLSLNATVNQLTQFLYRPTNFPTGLAQMDIGDPATVDKFVCKECVSGSFDLFQSLIEESMKWKNDTVMLHWLPQIFRTFVKNNVNKRTEKLLYYYPKIFGIIAEELDAEKYERAKRYIRSILGGDGHFNFIGNSKNTLQDLLTKEYYDSENQKAKYLYLILIINNVYRASHTADEIEVFKDALVDEKYKNTGEISDLTINY